MGNFSKFITEDIDYKKNLLSTILVNGKLSLEESNKEIDSISKKYKEYRAHVKRYLIAKSNSFNLKKTNKNLEELNSKISILERVRFILNPSNTFLEKMGFDNLLFAINNYSEFNFNSLNKIIDEFLNKFELAEINLCGDDFDYTCYVNEYMTSFLKVKSNQNNSLDQLFEIFEDLYWANPEIIEHIELNFRKLIKKNKNKFVDYIIKLQKDVMIKNNINSYSECLERLKDAYSALNAANRENICDIIQLAKLGDININDYSENSKLRTSTYNSLMFDSLNLNNKVGMNKFYDDLEKLKTNIEEYDNYMKFFPLFEDFKKEYEKLLSNNDRGRNKYNINNNLKTIELQISVNESKLDKINKRIFKGEPSFVESKINSSIKQLKNQSIKLAKELYNLYKNYDQEFFENMVLPNLNSSFTISDLLHLYYSFDFFKKKAMKRVYNISDYDEIIKYSDSFNLFATNPTNIIIDGVTLFEENNIAKVIINKYRLNNIKLNKENLELDNLNNLLNRIKFLLRINEIEKSSTTIEKIWFMAEVEKINRIENK